VNIISIFEEKHFAFVISDVHLGHLIFGDDSAVQFEKLLTRLENGQSLEIEHFIILGDFLDFWRDDDAVLFDKYQDFFERLSLLKTKDGKIKNLHYVVGNHDYLIPHYSQNEKYSKLLKEFQINKATTVPPDPLILSQNNGQASQEYRFEHGHQEEAASLGDIYDSICIGLCAQGRAAGDFTSILYKYLPETIGLFLGLGALIAYIFQHSFIALILVIGMILSFLSALIRRQTESTEKKLYHTMRKSPSKKRREKLRRLAARNPSRRKMIEQIPQEYQHIAENLPRLDEIVIAPHPTTPIRIVGHTHHLVEGDDNTWNPGAWVEGSMCGILTISDNGDIDMHSCIREISRPLRRRALHFAQQMARW